jgi:hypothetical protein
MIALHLEVKKQYGVERAIGKRGRLIGFARPKRKKPHQE